MKINRYPSWNYFRKSFVQAWMFGLFFLFFLSLFGCPKRETVRRPDVRPSKPPTRRTVLKKMRMAKPAFLSKRYSIPIDVPLLPTRGPRNVPIQIVELLNPTSPQLKHLESIRSFVWKTFPGKVRWTVRLNPRIGKDRGYTYARALFAAHRMGIFWSYLKHFVAHPSQRDFKGLLHLASLCGVEPQLFELLWMRAPHKTLIDRDMRWAWKLKKTGQTGIYVNGFFLPSPYTPERLKQAIEFSLQQTQSALAKGIQPKDVYTKLMQKSIVSRRSERLPEAIYPKRYIHVPFGYLESIPTQGPGDAPLHIVEFSDFTCVPCRKAYLWLERILKKYPKKIRFSFKYYPIGIHRESYRAAELAAAAQERKRFWKVYNLLFLQQKKLLSGGLLKIAKQAGLNLSWLAEELDRRSFRRRVLLNRAHARRLGVRGVPTLLINGLRISGMGSAQILQKRIQEELWKAGSPDPAYP